MLTPVENETKATNPASYDEYLKMCKDIEWPPQPIVIHCEWCNHKVTSYEPLPKSLKWGNPICGKEIDLK